MQWWFVRRPPEMPDVLFGWSQFHASRAFAMLPSLDLYGAPRGTSNVAPGNALSVK
jgi:hypothetical protein